MGGGLEELKKQNMGKLTWQGGQIDNDTSHFRDKIYFLGEHFKDWGYDNNKK